MATKDTKITKDDLITRDARPDDAAAIVSILNPIIEARAFSAFDTPFTVEAEREYIENLHPRAIFRVAIRQSDQRLVGFQTLDAFAGYTTHAFDHVGVMGTYVDAAARRQGVARKLFETTFEAAIAKGYEKIFTYVRADNQASLATYLGQGFRIVGTAERHAKIDGRDIDEIVIERQL